MAKDNAIYESPYKIKKRQLRNEIIESYNLMKKNPKNSTSVWKKKISAELGITEHAVMYYLRNRNKSNN